MADPLATGLIAASLMIAIAIAAWTTLKGWQGWLELKRFELTHGSADKALPPATGGGSRSPTCANGCASSKRSPPESISSKLPLAREGSRGGNSRSGRGPGFPPSRTAPICHDLICVDGGELSGRPAPMAVGHKPHPHTQPRAGGITAALSPSESR